MTYLARQNSLITSSNGAFHTFKVQVSEDGESWTEVDIDKVNGETVTTAPFTSEVVDMDGKYVTVTYDTQDNPEEKELIFKELQQNVKYVKFVIKESYGAEENRHMNAAELGILKAKQSAFTSRSLTLEGQIGVNFYVRLTEADKAKDSKAVKIADTEYALNDENYIADTDEYKVSARMNAAEMVQDVKAELIIDGTVVDTSVLSIKEYGEIVLSTSGMSEEMKALAAAMLNYGGYAQVKFDKDIANLANAKLLSLMGVENNPITAVSEISGSAEKAVDTAVVKSYSLVLESETALRFFLTDGVVNDLENVTIKLDNQIVAATDVKTSRDGARYVAVENIAAQDLENVHTLEITMNGETHTVKLSPMDYAASALNTNNEDLKNVVKALYLYNQAADAYFATR